ncbi:MAG: M48 family metallopeptidase [Actinomycetes bacterium]
MSVENFFQGELFLDILRPVLTPTDKPPTSNPSSNPSRLRSITPTDANPLAPGKIAPKNSNSGQNPKVDLDTLPPHKVIRSPRRKRSISAFRRNGLIEIHLPARTSKRDEATLIPEMIALVLTRESKQRRTEAALEEMATQLLTELLPEFHERPSSLTWRAMRDRWGSCTTVDRTIRISDRLASAPAYVLRCVLFHELIHLRVPNHSKEFYTYLSRFPELARAEAYLDGYEAGNLEIPLIERKQG